jgi:hypothetical protein
MLFNASVPYRPNTVVYFIVEDAIRKGVVTAVHCKLTSKGEERCWCINEYITENEPVNWDVHDMLLISCSLEGIIERAEKSIRPFITATKIGKEKEEDMFE